MEARDDGLTESQIQRTRAYLLEVRATSPGPMLLKALYEVEQDLAEQERRLAQSGQYA